MDTSIKQTTFQDDGEINGDTGHMGFDVSDASSVVKAFQHYESEIGEVFDRISLFMVRLDKESRISQFTTAAERILNARSADVVGGCIDSCSINWDKEMICEGIKAAIGKDEVTRLEDVRFQKQAGNEGFLSITVIPVHDISGHLSGIVLLGYDVIERKVIEMKLVESHKLESIGQLASSIAREVNTPIQYIGDNTRFLRDAFKDLDLFFEKFEGLMVSIKKGAITSELIQNMESAAEDADWDYLAEEIPKAIEQTLEGIERVSGIVRAMKELSQPGVKQKSTMERLIRKPR